MGQLSLVEHALCPLDFRKSLKNNLTHDASYAYSRPDGQRATAHARIFAPLGLSPNDEFYLWGLLALTLQEQGNHGELNATPHWCLRQLGVIKKSNSKGGRQYKLFEEAIRRLAAVSYVSDAFYDPSRGEHRRVSFRFFSYSLPLDPASTRAWRFAWDSIFLQLVDSPAGHLRFDLAVYRELDPATRRLFLFVSKVLSRLKTLHAVSLESLAVDLLGFSASLEPRKMRAKVQTCLDRLKAIEVLASASVTKSSRGQCYVRLTRGPYLTRKQRSYSGTVKPGSPLLESLCSIGFQPADATRLLGRYPHHLLAEWADITQAAIESKGSSFFRKTPMAYLVDAVKHAAVGERTPPDWWHEMRRREERIKAASADTSQAFERIRREVFGMPEKKNEAAHDKQATGIDSVAKILQRLE